MTDVDINPFGEHESRTEEATDENNRKASKKHHLEALRSR